MTSPDHLKGMQFKFLKGPNHALGTHRIRAVKDDEVVGEMEWASRGGYLANITVSEDFQRKGIATKMWKLGNRLSVEHGVSAPRHTPYRSESGDAWARKVGGELPPRDPDWEND